MARMRSQSDSGFTLFELLIVVTIVSVLAAIAAPGWGTFANRQKAKRASDQILQGVRQTQSEARRLRSNRAIEFDPTDNTINYPGDGSADGVPLAEGDFDANSLVFTAQNGAGEEITEIWFSANGGLDLDRGIDISDLPIYLTVTPQNSNTYRCVIIRSLIGGLNSGKSAEDCGQT